MGDENQTVRKVQVHRTWISREEELMTRLHGILTSSRDGPFQKDGGYRWQLDASNDWWAELHGTELTLATRYSARKLSALAAFVTAFLGPE